MAFSSSSYFAGIGTAFAAIAVGFAGGAMITTSAVQPPNKLEQRAASNATPPSSAPSNVNAYFNRVIQPGSATSKRDNARDAAAGSGPGRHSRCAANDRQPRPTIATKTDAAANAQQPPTSPPQAARNEDAAPAKNERANVRPAELNRQASRSGDMKRETSRRRDDELKFAERKRRQDLERQDLDEATSVVRQMPRDGATDRVVEEDDAPRVIDGPPRRFGLFGDDEDSPRAPPPRFGLFGN